jgi:CRISPR type II-A-associated protein Csn2
MTLSHYDFETIFQLNSFLVNVLIVEREDYFFKYCAELNNQISGGDGNFCLYDGDNKLSLAKNSIIFTDLFNISVNDKKVTTRLLAYLTDLANNKFILEIAELHTVWADIFSKMNAESDCRLDYDGGEDLSALFKAFGVKIADDDDSLLDRLVSYINVSSSLLKIKNFFFVNLKSFLNLDELKKLYHEAQLNEVNLFLLESAEREVLEQEKIVIIDKDLCEIVVN